MANLGAPATSAASSTWSNPTSSGPAADQFAAMAYDTATGTDVLFTSSGQTWTGNGSTWTQQSPAASPSERRWAAMAYDSARGAVVLFGGYQDVGVFYADTWGWDGSAWNELVASAACSKALANGSQLDNLDVFTYNVRRGEPFPPCKNCAMWVPNQEP